MYNALRTIYTNNIKDKVVEKINLFPDLGDLTAKFQNIEYWPIDYTQKFENRYTVRKGRKQWFGLQYSINYKKPGTYKFTAYIKSNNDNEPVLLAGLASKSNNTYITKSFKSKMDWQQIEFIFDKTDITVPDNIRLGKTNDSPTILYISKYELTPVGEIEKVENEPKKITINSLNLLDNTQINKSTTWNVLTIKDEEITSKLVSDWNVFIIGYVQSVILKKDKLYQLSFDLKGTENKEHFNKVVLLTKVSPSKPIETTLNKPATTYTLSTEYQRYVYYIIPKTDVEIDKFFIQHNGNLTPGQFIVRNIMLSEVTSDYDENYFKKSFIINKFDNTDDKFIELIDEMINLDLENKRYILMSE